MAIRISRNDEGNCITFIGSSNPAYWNACLSAELSDDPDRFHIINDIRSQNEPEIQYEFYNVIYTDFADADGNAFTSAQAAVDYVNANANVIGLNGGSDLTGIDISFRLDQTSTTILSTTGSQWGVNSVKAVVASNGLIAIHSIGEGVPTGSEDVNDKIHYSNIEHARVSIDGTAVAGGAQDVVNALNELFTVGAFTQVVISDPYSTMVADVDGTTTTTTRINNGFDPVGDDVYATSVNNANTNGFKTNEAIDQAGEYFTFDIRNEAIYGFGLVHTDDSYAAGNYVGSSYADPAGFGITNNSHAGFQFSHWFHPTPNGSWTNYGANTSYVQGPGWYSSNTEFEGRDEWLAGDPIKIKVGIDENGFIAISSLKDDGVTWVLHARSAYSVPQGASFHLGIKAGDTTARIYSQPKVHLLAEEVTAPTTLGDQSITVFEDNTGDITGTLAGGIASTVDDPNQNDGFVSTETISAVGEYFQFEWSAGDANVGLFSDQDHAVGDMQTDRSDWGNEDYIYFGARTENNGELNSIYYEAGGHTSLASSGGAYYGRVGFDADGRAKLWYSSDGTNWTAYRRSNQSAPVGTYRFIWVSQDSGANLDSLTKGTMTFAPTMNFRYIESPDGVYQYPLFATEEEANYYDLNHAGTTGTGTSHAHVYVDDPTQTTWYMPDTGRIMNGATPPQDVAHTVFQGQTVTYTEITSLTNADLVPPAFTATDLTVDELTNVNYQTQPAGTAYTTTITGLPSGLTDGGGGMITGTAPEVANDLVTNPSDTYTITVTRTNSYGSSTGTFDIIVNNLTPVPTAIAGFTHIATSATMVDGDTLADGSAVTIDNVLEDGKRIVFSRTWMETYVRDTLQTGTNQKVFIGIASGSASWGSIDTPDFVYGYQFEKGSTSSGLYVRKILNGSIISNISYSVFANDLVFFHDHSVSGYMMANLPNGGQGETVTTPTYTNNEYGSVGSGDQTFVIASVGTTMDISATGISEVNNPVVSTSLTNFAKALDFSGSSERAEQVTQDSNRIPMKMNGQASLITGTPTSGYTSNNSSAKPWATAVVFKIDGNSSNQHIWNVGSGSGSTDDNIYLRVDANGNLYFGWGRSGALNECRIMTAISSAFWYAVYIGHDGRRWASAGATAGNLYQTFDIRVMSSHDSFASSQDKGTFNDWNQSSSTTGGRMDRNITGPMTIGGRGTNRSFHGKVASYVTTTLRRNQPMPDTTEIELMITDPKKWLQDYKVGNPFRLPWQTSDAGFNFALNDGSSSYSTQVWLMGDGTNDSYSNMIRNQVMPSDQNYTKLNLISMVSNDIENVTIPGLG